MVIASGCESTPARHPRETHQVALSVDRVMPDMALEAVNAVQVLLPAGPEGSEGYAWEISSNNVKVLEQMGPMVPTPGADPRCAPPTSVSFYALKPGSSVLRFVLIRPNVAEAIPAAKCEVTVRVSY
jgi:hypothetical protein